MVVFGAGLGVALKLMIRSRCRGFAVTFFIVIIIIILVVIVLFIIVVRQSSGIRTPPSEAISSMLCLAGAFAIIT